MVYIMYICRRYAPILQIRGIRGVGGGMPKVICATYLVKRLSPHLNLSLLSIIRKCFHGCLCMGFPKRVPCANFSGRFFGKCFLVVTDIGGHHRITVSAICII